MQLYTKGWLPWKIKVEIKQSHICLKKMQRMILKLCGIEQPNKALIVVSEYAGYAARIALWVHVGSTHTVKNLREVFAALQAKLLLPEILQE